MAGYRISERRACRTLRFARSSHRYRSCAKDQTALRLRLRDLAATRVRYGYRRLYILLRREGWKVNHKRIYRLYQQEGLSLRIKRKKRISVQRVPLPPATAPNERWSMDFMIDGLFNGQRFRVLTLVDNFSKVSPAVEADFSFPGRRVVEVLERIATTTGRLPKVIHVDNGPEFAGKALDEWAHRWGVKLSFSRPGKPTDNAFIEAFNGRLRQECLDQNWFLSLEDARQKLKAWHQEYNTQRPHTALGMQAPACFSSQWHLQASLAEAQI